jgi:methionyl-tRNA formyltransferase
MTGGELSELLASLGAEAVVEVLNQIDAGTVNLIEQDSLHATYAPKLLDEDLEIRWDRSVVDVANLVRALSPHVGARAFHSGVEGPVKIWRAEVFDGEVPTLEAGAIRTENGRILVGCGAGVLEVLELQMPGGMRLAARDFLRGNTLQGTFDR